MWQQYYQPIEQEKWQGRMDSVRFHQVVRCLDLREEGVEAGAIVLVGFCCDEGVRRNYGKVGAAEGPAACRNALAGLPFHGEGMLYDGGDIICFEEKLEEAQEALGTLLALLHQKGAFPIVLGGGHEVAWAQHLGLHRAFPEENYSIVNLDAHFDLRPLEEERGSSGTPFLQIAQQKQEQGLPFDYCCLGIHPFANTKGLFAMAEELGVLHFSSEEIYSKGLDEAYELIDQVVVGNERVYATLCLDVFGQAYAPGVSAPQPFGILPVHGLQILRYLLFTGKVRTLDVAELNPHYDRDGQTAALAAQLIAFAVTSLLEQKVTPQPASL